MFLLPASIKRIELKTIKKEWRHRFIPLQAYGVIIRCPRADNPRVIGPIWPKFEIFLDIMHVRFNCKIYSKLIGSITIDKKWRLQFLRRSRLAYTVVLGLILWNFECIQVFMCAIDDVVFPNIGLWDFFRRRGAAYLSVCGKIRPNFELIQAPKYIVTCKYEKDLIKKSRENSMTPFSPL